MMGVKKLDIEEIILMTRILFECMSCFLTLPQIASNSQKEPNRGTIFGLFVNNSSKKTIPPKGCYDGADSLTLSHRKVTANDWKSIFKSQIALGSKHLKDYFVFD